MRAAIFALIFMCLTGVVGYYGALKWEVASLMQKTYATWTPANVWHHGGPLVGGKAWVPGANPDFLISRATYDLREGPVRLKGLMPPQGVYWSLALYGGDSRNFFLSNDRAHSNGRYDYLLLGPGAEASDAVAEPGVTVIQSPSSRGYAVIRILNDPRVNTDALSAAQHAAAIEPHVAAGR